MRVNVQGMSWNRRVMDYNQRKEPMMRDWKTMTSWMIWKTVLPAGKPVKSKWRIASRWRESLGSNQRGIQQLRPISFKGLTMFKLILLWEVEGDRTWLVKLLRMNRASLVVQTVKNLPAMWETWVGKIPWRRAWQPTPVFLPGESHGQGSLVGYSPWSLKESDTTDWLSTAQHLGWTEHGD